MISTAPVVSNHQPYPTPHPRPRLLIFSDCPDRLTKLSASLAAGEIEITSATSPEELRLICRDGHDLAVIDVSPTSLVAVLDALRDSEGYAEIPVLVEATRLAAAPGLTGVLPKYRAMPCSHAELVTLARSRISATKSAGLPSACSENRRRSLTHFYTFLSRWGFVDQILESLD